MSGHNKWSKIKRTKGIADIQKGKVFTRILRELQVAVREGGVDPKHNPRLREALVEARSHNMPKENIDRAISRASSTERGDGYEEVLYEAYGASGVGLLIDCLTDNRNRTVADLRALLTRKGGSLVDSGAVSWMFTQQFQETDQGTKRCWVAKEPLYLGEEALVEVNQLIRLLEELEDVQCVYSSHLTV